MEENGMKAKLEVELIKEENPVESVTKNNNADELISLTLPTQTRSNKRKHIRFCIHPLFLSQSAAPYVLWFRTMECVWSDCYIYQNGF